MNHTFGIILSVKKKIPGDSYAERLGVAHKQCERQLFL